MGDTSFQIEQHIRDTRNDLSDNFNELEEKVKTAVDWRAHFEERPGTMIALAFGGGVLLSALLPTVHSSSRRRTPHGSGNARPEQDAAGISNKSGAAFDEPAGKTSETLAALKATLIGMATSKLADFVEEMLPGFKQEFTKAQTGISSDRSSSPTSGEPTDSTPIIPAKRPPS